MKSSSRFGQQRPSQQHRQRCSRAHLSCEAACTISMRLQFLVGLHSLSRCLQAWGKNLHDVMKRIAFWRGWQAGPRCIECGASKRESYVGNAGQGEGSNRGGRGRGKRANESCKGIRYTWCSRQSKRVSNNSRRRSGNKRAHRQRARLQEQHSQVGRAACCGAGSTTAGPPHRSGSSSSFFKQQAPTAPVHSGGRRPRSGMQTPHVFPLSYSHCPILPRSMRASTDDTTTPLTLNMCSPEEVSLSTVTRSRHCGWGLTCRGGASRSRVLVNKVVESIVAAWAWDTCLAGQTPVA